MEAAHRFAEVRPHLIDALKSENPEVRSAAVAAFNEADDATAHDAIFVLSEDPDPHVRGEVLEYIEQFPNESDASYLFAKLEIGEQPFLASSGLRRLFGDRGPLLADDDESNELLAGIVEWRGLLRARGLVV